MGAEGLRAVSTDAGEGKPREMSSHANGDPVTPARCGTRAVVEGAAPGRSWDGAVEEEPGTTKHDKVIGFGGTIGTAGAIR